MRNSARQARMTAPRIHRVTTLDLRVAAIAWPFARRAARRDRRALRRQAAREAENLERPRPARAQSGLRRRALCAPIISRPISQVSWRGATGAFPIRTSSTALAWARCAAPTARSSWAKWPQHTANAGRIYFPSGTPDLDDISGGAVDIEGSVVREVEEETGLTPADYRAGPHWDCVVTGASVAMIRILQVDMPGEALARADRGQSRPAVAARACGDPSGAARQRSHRCDAALRDRVCRKPVRRLILKAQARRLRAGLLLSNAA